MRTLKGVMGAIIMAVVFGGAVMIILINAAYTGLAMDQIDLELSKNYANNLLGAKVIENYCSTKRRGVFYNSSILAGDFHCLDPPKGSKIHLKFIIENRSYAWEVYDKRQGTVVESFEDIIQYRQGYKVLVYDSLKEKTENATLKVGYGD